MKKFDLQVGMTVFLAPIGNQARRSSEIETRIVKRIGRKYFEVWDGKHEYSTVKFYLENFQQENGGYIANWSIYKSEQEILDAREMNSLNHFFKYGIFGGYTNSELSLDQLRRMKEIVEEEQK